MTTATEEITKNADLRVVNGGTLYPPPWESGNAEGKIWSQGYKIPDVYATGSTQLYPTGTIYRYGIRTFAYTKLSSDSTVVGAGFCPESTAEYVSLTNVLVSGAAGANTVVITKAGITVDQYAGGFLGIKMGTGGITTVGRYSSRQIIKNTVADGSNNVIFTLDGTNVLALTTADDCVLAEHPYAEIRTPATANYHMCVGIYINTVVVSNYVWVQTAGPHNMLSMIATFEGGSANSVPCYAIAGNSQVSEGGATGDATCNGIEGTSLQCIGHVYASTDIGGPSGSPADITIAPTVWLNILQ